MRTFAEDLALARRRAGVRSQPASIKTGVTITQHTIRQVQVPVPVPVGGRCPNCGTFHR